MQPADKRIALVSDVNAVNSRVDDIESNGPGDIGEAIKTAISPGGAAHEVLEAVIIETGASKAALRRTYGGPVTNLNPEPEPKAGNYTWYSGGAGTGGVLTEKVVPAAGHNGQAGFVITMTTAATGGGGGIANGRQFALGEGSILVEPGKTYTASIYGKSTANLSVYARLYWINAAGSNQGFKDGTPASITPGEEHRFHVTGVAPANAAAVVIQLRPVNMPALGTGKLTASECMVTEGSVAVQYRDRKSPGAIELGPTPSAILGPPETMRVAAWGDSIQYNGGADGTAPIDFISSALGVPGYNGGIIGESSTQVADRQTADTTTTDWVQILGLGHNGASNWTPKRIVDDIKRCVDHLTGERRFLVMELLPWAEHTTEQRANYNAVIAATKAAYPAQFVPVASWLRTQQAADAAGITFTADDLTDIAAGDTPRTFRANGVDPIHLSRIGRKAYAHRITQDIKLRGWN